MKNQRNQRRNGPTQRQQPSGRGGESPMSESPLHEVFLEELADIHDAEQQLIKALPKMAKAAKSDELRQAFEDHLEETKRQAERLEEVAASVEEKLSRKSCKGMEGLLKEANEMMTEHKDDDSLDAVLIAGAQKVEHYEIASYGTLAAWAKLMGHDEAAELLGENLEEEKAADEKLSQIATSVANTEAEA